MFPPGVHTCGKDEKPLILTILIVFSKFLCAEETYLQNQIKQNLMTILQKGNDYLDLPMIINRLPI